MKLALAQMNPTVGDFAGNQQKILAKTRQAAALDAGLVAFPELAICGYPPADLLEKDAFVRSCRESLEQIAAALPDIAILVGYAAASPGPGKRAANAAALLHGGEVIFEQHKMLLPYYDVFDEQRYFEPAESQRVFEFHGRRLAITICEDAWNDKGFWPRPLYETDPVDALMQQGADIVLNISASPFWAGKPELRREMLAAIARRHGVPVAMVNQVGGDDSLVFDGHSLVFGADGAMLAEGRGFAEDVVCFELPAAGVHPARKVSGEAISRHGAQMDRPHVPRGRPADSTIPSIAEALVLGTRDYVRKCGFRQAIVGLSGGLDSALVATIAADALGPDNVLGILMPSQYSSPGSISDAEAAAKNLGIQSRRIGIEGAYREFEAALAPAFEGRAHDITEENLQSRIRGTLLMALSNKFGALVLTTGNKSEMAVGYATLYGDMAGALAVIGDVFKTDCYRVARWLNRDRVRIPQATMDKPPSAELRPGQQDSDSLPPYDVLDPILRLYVEDYCSGEDIARMTGAAPELVRHVLKLVERAEYKRQQAAPILKVSRKSFGPGRRFPIAARAQV